MLIARSSPECHLYMELHPCERCGDASSPGEHRLVQGGGEALVAVYEGACPGCGQQRQFEFELDPELPPSGAFGGAKPSSIIDPGQFLAIADQQAKSVPGDTSGLDDAARAEAARRMRRAVSALEEVLKFADADAVPASAFTEAASKEAYLADPGRFKRRRLEAVLGVYRESLGALLPPDDPGLALIKKAMEALNDPTADARFEAARNKREDRQTLVILGFRGLKGNVEERWLHDLTEIRHYLTARKSREVDGAVEIDVPRDGGTVLARLSVSDGVLELSSGERTLTLETSDEGLVSTRTLEDALAAL